MSNSYLIWKQERPYMCQTCGFSTHTKSAMIRHNLSHTGEKPHVCDTCGSAYADKKRLRDHKLSQHHDASQIYDSRTIQTHACDFCGFSSRRKDNLRAHIRRVHPELNISHNSNAELGNTLTLPGISGTLEPLPRASVNLNMVMNNLYDPPKTEETKPDIRLVNSSILTSPSVREKAVLQDHDRSMTEKVSGNQLVSSCSSRMFDDRSHIIGHINHDGSIRPVATVTPSNSATVMDNHHSCTEERSSIQDTPQFMTLSDNDPRLEKK